MHFCSLHCAVDQTGLTKRSFKIMQYMTPDDWSFTTTLEVQNMLCFVQLLGRRQPCLNVPEENSLQVLHSATATVGYVAVWRRSHHIVSYITHLPIQSLHCVSALQSFPVKPKPPLLYLPLPVSSPVFCIFMHLLCIFPRCT